MKRYAVHKTSSAPASRISGAVALSLAVVAFAAKRLDVIGGDVFVLSLLAAGLIAIVSLTLAVSALQRIWTYGGSGLAAALNGIVLAVLALAPTVLVLAMLMTHAGTGDISTDRSDPPKLTVPTTNADQPFLAWLDDRLEGEILPIVMDIADTGQAELSFGERRYPDIVPRRYRIAPAQLHAAAAKALDGLHWRVVGELPPDLLDAPTGLHAEESTQILGLKHDVVLRIRPDPVGARLDVRSKSRTPLRDLTGDPDNIRTLLAEIDSVLLETYGDLARLTVEDGGLEEVELPTETIEEPRETIPLPAFKPYYEGLEDPTADDLRLGDLEG